MQEGILSLMQMAKTSAVLERLHEAKLLYIFCVERTNLWWCDSEFCLSWRYMIAEPGARIGFAGRRVIEQTIRQKLPNDFQTAEYLLKHGQIDMVIERARLADTIARLIDFHQVIEFRPDAIERKVEAISNYREE